MIFIDESWSQILHIFGTYLRSIVQIYELKQKYHYRT